MQLLHEFMQFGTNSSTRLPTGFETAVKAVIANDFIFHNDTATLSIVLAAGCIETNPAAGSLFSFRRQITGDYFTDIAHAIFYTLSMA